MSIQKKHISQDKLNRQFLNAAHEGNTVMVQHLAEHSEVSQTEERREGADINSKNDYGKDALMLALLKDHSETANWLIEAGININHINTRNGQNALSIAVHRGNLKIIDKLVEYGADTKFRDYQGNNLCKWAVIAGNEEALKKTISISADINTPNDRGETPLMWAASYRNLPVAELLVSSGANLNAQDNRGRTALMFALTAGNEEMASFLCEKGADVNLGSELEGMPLAEALRKGLSGAVEILLAHGADVYAKNASGKTVLEEFFLSQYGLEDIKEQTFFSFIAHAGLSSQDIQSITEQTSMFETREGWSMIKGGVFTLASAVAMFPERSVAIDKLLSTYRLSFFLNNAIGGNEMNKFFPAFKILSVLTGLKTGKLFNKDLSSGTKEIVVSMALEVFESDPVLAVSFIQKRVGKNLETWHRENIPGVDELISKCSAFLQKNNSDTPTVIDF